MSSPQVVFEEMKRRARVNGQLRMTSVEIAIVAGVATLAVLRLLDGWWDLVAIVAMATAVAHLAFRRPSGEPKVSIADLGNVPLPDQRPASAEALQWWEVLIVVAIASVIVAINKLVIGDQGSEWGSLLMVAATPGTLVVVALRIVIPTRVRARWR